MKSRFAIGAVLASVFAFAIADLGSGVSAQTAETTQSVVNAQSSTDCTDVSVDYEHDPLLTQEEQIALMNQAFFRSLSKYDVCQNAQDNVESTSSSSADMAGAGSGLASSDMSGDEPSQSSELVDTVASTASSEMSGTEVSASTSDAESSSYQPENGAIASASTSAPVASDAEENEFGNGKIPDDIPAVDNDSILEAQIRQAAIDETDPEMKAELWNEYRRYKGLAVVNE
ncbi:MAG: hypothetical protein VCD33_07505 [Alphaproteobacteria bacterium]